jgi:dsRNA-specific ribonuclease
MDKTINNKLDWGDYRVQILQTVGKDNLIKYILNEKNRVITKDYIKNTMTNYGIDYTPKDMKLFKIAMTHPSYIYKDWTTDIDNFKLIFMGINVLGGVMIEPINNDQINMAVGLGTISYERLELLGDSILRQIITEYLFLRYSEMREGGLTQLRSRIGSGFGLAEITRKIGLNKYVLISRNHEIIKSREKNEKLQCDIFEAFIAALYLDACNIKFDEIGECLNIMSKNRGSGYQTCFDFVVALIEDEIVLTNLLETDINYKAKLGQHYHDLGWSDPKYGIMDTIVNNNMMGKKFFKMYVRDNDNNIIGWGIATSKQKGEKIAAKKALEYLKTISTDTDEQILNKNDPQIYHKETITTFNNKVNKVV